MFRARISLIAIGLPMALLICWLVMRDDQESANKSRADARARASGRDPSKSGGGGIGVASVSVNFLVPDAQDEASWFGDRGTISGVDFQHYSGNSPDRPQPALHGSGVAALDFDRDGRNDLYFATGVSFPI